MGGFEAYFILGIIIVIAFIFVFLYAVWCFISSAVEAGTKKALKDIITELTELDFSFKK